MEIGNILCGQWKIEEMEIKKCIFCDQKRIEEKIFIRCVNGCFTIITLASTPESANAPSRCIICSGEIKEKKRYYCGKCNKYFLKFCISLTP